MNARSLLLLLLPCLPMAGCLDDDGISPADQDDLTVGALLALTGDNSASGAQNLAGLQCALEDAREELGARVKLAYGDTRSLPMGASVLMDSYLLQGHRVVVGPPTSEEVEAVKDEIAASGSLLISPSSTALTLAGPDDHVFRLAPNDSHLVAELVEVMWQRGHRYLALIHRDDSWGRSVAEELEDQFTERGGTVISAGPYGALRVDLLNEILSGVADDIATAGDNPPASQVAIHLASLDEGSLLMQVAMDSVPELALYDWYGTDGFVQNDYLVSDPDLAAFAAQVEYTAPIFSVDPSPGMAGAEACIQARTGTQPGAYALLTYDAMRIAARTLAEAGIDASYTSLEATLMDVLGGYEGLSGQVSLDANGDRVGGTYDFFSVEESGGSYGWVKVSPSG